MTAADLEFRELTSTDAKLYDVARMHYPAWQDCYTSIIAEADRAKVNGRDFVDVYKKSVDQDGRSLLTAQTRGELVGMAIFGVIEGQGRIDALYLALGRKRRGYGTALLAEVLTRLNTAVTTLQCAIGNSDGQAFWEHSGFRRVGEGDPFDPGAGIPPARTYRYQLDRISR